MMRFILAAGMIALIGATALSGQTLPAPNEGRFEHVVVVMMENRSFDHFLGWLPGANGQQAGLTYFDSAGVPHQTHALAPDYQGCGFLDPGHGYQSGRVQYNNGGANGWLLDGAENDVYAIGYYGAADVPFYAQAAENFTVCDNYFSGILSSTYPNRFYMHAAQTDRLQNDSNISTLPTIWSRLEEKGLSGRYYFSDLPFLALWGERYVNISKPIAQFFADAAAGRLANVTFIDPRFGGEEQGLSNDDHPHADIRAGQDFLNRIYDALRASPNWSRTVLIINYDEWGGFYDHVPPPLAPIPPASAAAGDVDGRLGFRTPCVVISPLARKAFIAHGQYDHTSVLKRFELQPLTVRDQTANNLAEVLDFSAPATSAPQFTVPPAPVAIACPPLANDEEAAERSEGLGALRELAVKHRFQGFARASRRAR